MRKTTPLLLVFALFLLDNCAEVGPQLISPKVYSSSRDAIVASHQADQKAYEADKELSKSNQLKEQLARERARERQKVKLAEIKGATQTQSTQPRRTIDSEGVLGGFPVIFVNDTRRMRIIFFSKAQGIQRGYRWLFTIPAGRYKEYKLETGWYRIQWTIEDYDYMYPTDGPALFEVRMEDDFFYEQTDKSYHGGYRLFGY